MDRRLDDKMRLSERANRVGESATLKVARRALELKADGVDIADFGAGEPDFGSPAVAIEAAKQALDSGFTKYTQAAGIPELREALAARYARDYSAPWSGGRFVVTVGAKAALFELAVALFEDGDEVLIPSPCWVSFPEQIRFAGASVVTVPMSPADGFRIHPEAILAELTDRTRAVLVNAPSNPTGGILTQQDFETLAARCAEAEVLLISDETYERFVYASEPSSAARVAAQYPDTVVLVGSFSKTYAMTGWRIGYVAGPQAVIQAVSKVQSHLTSNATSFAMKGALAALEGADDDVARMISEYRVRRELVSDWLDRMPGVTCAPPAGAFYAFPRVADCFDAVCPDSVELAALLLEEARVAVVPGAAFGNDEHIRISFACSRETLEQGLSRMAEVFSKRVGSP